MQPQVESPSRWEGRNARSPRALYLRLLASLPPSLSLLTHTIPCSSCSVASCLGPYPHPHPHPHPYAYPYAKPHLLELQFGKLLGVGSLGLLLREHGGIGQVDDDEGRARLERGATQLR